MEAGSAAWQGFAARARAASPDILLLNEMPFGSWIAAGEVMDPAVLRRSWDTHARGVAVLGELGVPVVLGTRAVQENGISVNQAFVWTAEGGATPAHTKQ
jgi:N-carbamoylputrescine amidase